MSDKTTLRRISTVHYPSELDTNGFCGPLYGYYHRESRHFNVIEYGQCSDPKLKLLCEILSDEAPKETLEEEIDAKSDNNPAEPLLHCWRDLEGKLIFRFKRRSCTAKPYEAKLNIFSRNTGILETDVMLHSSVVISGVGSVGSLAALDLARSGVGRFLLIDNDIMEYHNICRHQCGIADVGRYKVEAMKERILQINPYARVQTYIGILEDVPKELFDEFIDGHSLIIGCNDNRAGNIYANTVAAAYSIPLLAIGFWERAAAGEVFYTIPGEMPCYECAFGRGQDLSGKQVTTANRRFYTNQEDLRDTHFEPGIATDIHFVTNVGIKLALDLLNRNNSEYTTRLIDDLNQCTLICNTNKPNIGGEQVEIFAYPLQITRSLEVEYAKSCSVCRTTSSA
jgi:molybdopterin/thiamine biosynthesis adenylyltransferase